MEIVTVSGPPPDDTNSPEYLAWHEREFVMRGNMVLNQSSQIEALQAHVRSLEQRVSDVVGAARGLVEPPAPLELVEDENQAELPAPEPELPPPAPEKVCRECGCTDTTPCMGEDGVACHWVYDDLCSVCDSRDGPEPAPEPVPEPGPENDKTF